MPSIGHGQVNCYLPLNRTFSLLLLGSETKQLSSTQWLFDSAHLPFPPPPFFPLPNNHEIIIFFFLLYSHVHADFELSTGKKSDIRHFCFFDLSDRRPEQQKNCGIRRTCCVGSFLNFCSDWFPSLKTRKKNRTTSKVFFELNSSPTKQKAKRLPRIATQRKYKTNKKEKRTNR